MKNRRKGSARADDIIRSEIFSPERLEQHAASLARAQRVRSSLPRNSYLHKRLKDNEKFLRSAYREVSTAMGESVELPPAAEWLIDNYFIIEEQIRNIYKDFNVRYYNRLPKLADGFLKGYPRVYEICWAFIAHTDSFFNSHFLENFVRSYQRYAPLRIGELWAIVVVLRFALVENLRRAADQIIQDRFARKQADDIVNELLLIIDDHHASQKALDKFRYTKSPTAFYVQLIHRLRDQDPRVIPFLQRVGQELELQDTSIDEIVRAEHQRQSALTVTVRNIITSMRLISTFDWVKFFESVSLVDERLRAESHFAEMNLSTRNLYRRAIEDLSEDSALSELEVTEKVLQFAGNDEPTAPGDLTERRRDPGYYLIDLGQEELKAAIGHHASIWKYLSNASPAINFAVYLLSNILLVTFIIELGLTFTVHRERPLLALLILSTAVFFPAWEAAITIINRAVVALKRPSPLPAMALREGIPATFRTMVVVPTLLLNESELAKQIERLETHFLSNIDDNLSFALLSDWRDADVETRGEDREQLALAQKQIADLNLRHPTADGKPRFFLLHRRRVWNPTQLKWMGWERKRGKLHELNRLLRGATNTTYMFESDAALNALPENVRFVITLDVDTRLPRGAAQRLIGKLAHPLNRAHVDPVLGRVSAGYGILQPRVSSSLPERDNNSFFQRVFFTARGLDPYAFAVSDVYQDLFQEGSYIGKGIYDIDAFERSCGNFIPENSILSHDLLEGIYARAGLASDIEVIEEFPARYDVANARQHRWIRGDWQLLPWIFGSRSKPIPTIGHWKMLDNLRRSLTAPFTFLALLIGWTFYFSASALWTVLILVTFAMPLFLSFIENTIPRTRTSWPNYFFSVGKDFLRTLEQILLIVAFLPHQAWTSLDAVVRTLWRVFVSHRNLLQWTSAAEARSRINRSISNFYSYMYGGLALTATAFLLLLLSKSPDWNLALPFLSVWLASPWIAWRSSQPVADHRAEPLDPDEQQDYRLAARETWRFFETFVDASNNYLPPDNFQEDPNPVVARRTSPTNIGLYLLSIIAARDFGWLGLSSSLEKMTLTMASLKEMQRFRGHFLNWYETSSLQPLEPRYISSVDSGNLAGYFLIVANVFENTAQQPLLSQEWVQGLKDGAMLAQRAVDCIEDGTQAITRQSLLDNLNALIELLSSIAPRQTMMGAFSNLKNIDQRLSIITDLCSLYASEGQTIGHKRIEDRARELQAAAADRRCDIDVFSPWLKFLPTDGPNEPAVEELIGLLGGTTPALEFMPAFYERAEVLLDRCTQSDWTSSIRRTLRDAGSSTRSFLEKSKAIAVTARLFFDEMEFGFLLDKSRQLLSIGYRVNDGALDVSCYDLLASEARLASIVAIAKGDIPTHAWFRLGRTVTAIRNRPTLVSWSGSMFEYLMPSLVMNEPTESLLGQTNRMVVRRQIEYGAECGTPWGVSESAYNARDFEYTYQYQCFGVPGLGLKRGLGDNIVIAPYATALAATIDPKEALQNLRRIQALGGHGEYGWYEAIDFTKRRLPENESRSVVRTYMAHHQGMSLIAFLNVLKNGIMRDRFHADPIIVATDLLLQEVPPRNVIVAHPRFEEVEKIANIHEIRPVTPRCFQSPHGLFPRTALLSNSQYTIMLTAAGSGYSHWQDMSITRWREDPTRDNWGSFIYLRDLTADRVWSAAYQPTCIDADHYQVAFFEDHAEYDRRDGFIKTTLNVVVSSEDQGEARRITLLNQDEKPHVVELTSYMELVLGPSAADNFHPAFSKMFVETDYIAADGALLATRRPRSPEDVSICAVHLVSVGAELLGSLQYETDRLQFIGRGHSTKNPQALDGRALSNTVGTVLDPVFSLRCRLKLNPGETVHVTFWTLVTHSRAEALDLVDKYRSANAYNRAVAHAWTQAQLQYQHLRSTPEEAQLFQRLANHIIYSSRSLRAHPQLLKQGAGPQSHLWQVGVSGDKPIVLMRIDVVSDLKVVKQMIKAHEYWSRKQFEVDLVIINEQPTSYLESLQSEIELLVRSSQAFPRTSPKASPGTIYTLRSDQLPAHIRLALMAAARIIIVGHRGSLAEQLQFQSREDSFVPPPLPRVHHVHDRNPAITFSAPPLEFFNGLGGFTDDGRSYMTILRPGQKTPAPWINIISNPHFGFHVSAEGSGYTWSQNSRENKTTPWSNDPVSDEAGEAIYLADIDSGAIWTPTASPIRAHEATYVCKHGMGYSEFDVSLHGIETKLTQCVALNDAVKISRLIVRNTSNARRRISVSSYVEWVLGVVRGSSTSSIITEMDQDLQALFATNRWNNIYSENVAFLHMSGNNITSTADRREFIGRNGSLDAPAALRANKPLSGINGAGLDPCAVLQTILELRPGQEVHLQIVLGHTRTSQEAKLLVTKYRAANFASILEGVTTHWRRSLGVVHVKTPDRAMDIMLNGWLMYQTMACRIFARSAFYQASGAYGYRDQLQDVMTLVLNHPELTRAHIVRAAGRQFPEGDVQHWWLPSDDNPGPGIRTRFADDPLWLPYVTSHYINFTGDAAILDDDIHFLEGPKLSDSQHEAFFTPVCSTLSATLYEHCALAIDHSLSVGVHGLSLFGGGDWNDGMNRVGIAGKGESVWMCWFLLTVIKQFSPWAEARDPARAAVWRDHIVKLRAAVELNAWDGAWYRRGYYDSGDPLGSTQSEECQIDSLVQSWAIISGEANPDRQTQAMAEMEKHLIKSDEGIALLFTPPFDKTRNDPGYIKGYPKGLRENGGQYTHAALWVVLAYTCRGDGDKAHALFDMLNPIKHSLSRSTSSRYKVEPYVVAADVYSSPQHLGRGGWTWYTGSAGWMYRVGIESLLGLQLRGNKLHIVPCIPRHWPGFEMTYVHKSTAYKISVEAQGSGTGKVTELSLDRVMYPTGEGILLVDDGKEHSVQVILE